MQRPVRLFIIIISALICLAILSICPWSRWTGGVLKDFNLLGKNDIASTTDSIVENIDTELAMLTEELQSDSTSLETTTDTLDILITESYEAPRSADGTVLLEDFSADASQIANLKDRLAASSHRLVRIAMLGDSYIEGDILAQDIRSGLQDIYGGYGVGYVAAHSQFPGFRQSVNQTCNGWTETEIRSMKQSDPLRTIVGHYHTASPGAETRLKGTAKPAHTSRWDVTSVVFQAPADGTLTLSGSDNQAVSMAVRASDSLQVFQLAAPSGDIRLTTDIDGLKVAGIWLDPSRGISLDDISLRGNSGVSHRHLNAVTTAQLRQWVDYDVIILEFGMNALSLEQKNYTAYGRGMIETINNLKNLYPNAIIMIMGVGDRGTKIGGEYVSMPTLPALIKAQRDAARATGSLFYDTRAAMGGNGSAIEWHSNKLLNSDFVHLNHKGGGRLAEIILNSIDQSLK